MDSRHDLALLDMSLRPLSRSPRKAVLVVGMSRSGTSLLAHMLHVLGAALPRDLMGGGRGNPHGHFEPLGLVALNDRILRSLDRRWDDPRPIAGSWFQSVDAIGFTQLIVAQIRRSYGEAPVLVIKDPRLCRLLPLYLVALDVLDIEPLVILQMRPAAEVMRSLAIRDRMQPGLAALLWLRSVVEAEVQSRDCRRSWVSMAEMLDDWPAAIDRIAGDLQLVWPVEPEEAACEIMTLLRHNPPHRADLAPREDGTARLCAAAWSGAGYGFAGNEPAARSAFDAVRRALDDFDRMSEPYLSAISRMQASLSWRLTTPLRVVRGLLRGG